MVAALLNHESLFAVLGSAARRRGKRSLAIQCAACLAAAATLAIVAPRWWSLAALILASGLYAAFGLIVRARTTPGSAAEGALPFLAAAVTALGFGASIIGIVGLWLALFTGSGHSPYDACGRGASTAYCRAMKSPERTTTIP